MKNLSTMKKAKQTKRKIISIFFVVMVLLSISSISVFARSNSWGLVVSQVDGSYFHRNISQQDWSQVRKRCYADAQNLTSRFNRYVVETVEDKNIIHQIEYIYSNYDQTTASLYSDQWNNLNIEIANLITDVEQICGYGKNIPVVNGKEVTTEVYQNMISNISDKTTRLTNLVSNINSSYRSAKFNANDITSVAYKNEYDAFTNLWQQLGILIETVGTGSDTTVSQLFGVSWTADNIKSIADTVSPIIKTFAYFLAVALFGVNVSRSALQFELMETKGQIKIFAGVILVKVWVDLSINICIYIINIINSLTAQIINSFVNDLYTFEAQSANQVQFVDNDLFGGIGALFNFANATVNLLPQLLLMGVVIFCMISVIIRIISRGFEMTALVTVSPIFFATLVGDGTKQFFKKFMASFISTCCYLFFVAVVYAVGTIWMSDSISAPGITAINIIFGKNFPILLILLAVCHIIRKPPKVLTDLVAL